MNVRICALSILIVLGCLLGEAAAGERLIFLRDGSLFQGEVTASDWESVTIRRTREGGEEIKLTIKVQDLDPHFFYSVRDKVIEGDAKERIRLAEFAAQHDMFSRAKAQMDQARALDPEVVAEFFEKRFPEIREGLAERVLNAANRSLRRGSTRNAKKYASIILTKFEGTAAEPEAEKLLDVVQKRIDEEEARKRAQRRKMQARDAEREAKRVEEERDRILDPVEKLMDEASRKNTQGLRERSLGKARDAFDLAGKRYERVVTRLDDRLKGALPDDEIRRHLVDMRAEAVEGGVDAYLNAARALAARSTYQEAVKFTNRALALAPHNAAALSARAAISTTSGGWGRRRGGRR